MSFQLCFASLVNYLGILCMIVVKEQIAKRPSNVSNSLRNKTRQRQLLSMVSLIPLSACGGGGGGSPSPNTPPAPDPPANLAPTNITLSASSVVENDNSAVVIGTLTTTDSDSSSHTYTVSDARFEVVSGELRLKAGNSLNYETILGSGSTASISLDITTQDGSGNTYTKTFTITVTDVNDAPSAIDIDTTTVSENSAGAIIGTLVTTDEDANDSITYSVSDDRFEVVSGQLKLKDGVSLDYETETTVTFDVTSTDSGGLSFTQSFTITVEDVADLSGVIISGISADDLSGWAVSGLGDVNGDGIDDFIIGAPTVDSGGFTQVGASYIVFGSDSGLDLSLDLSMLNGTNGFVITAGSQDISGYSVSEAGDVNGDGVGDILVGAPNGVGYGFADRAGEAYVIFGSSSGFSVTFDIASLDGANGFIIGGLEDLDAFGASVSSAGDINNDGIDDIIVGAYSSDPSGRAEAGETYIIFGSNLGFSTFFDPSTLDGSNGFVLSGMDAGDQSGITVSNAGDINGDGIDDVIIGALYADPNGNNFAGESYVIFGSGAAFGASIDLSALDGTNGFVINGIEASDASGFSVSFAGDVNGDGVDDVIIGELGANSSSNESYVVFGSSSAFNASIDLSSLDGTNGFAIHGINTNDRAGYSVSSAGDINGDGFADIIIGAPAADPDGKDAAGESYIVFGSDSGFAAEINLSALDGTNGFSLSGSNAGDNSGWFVSSAGDVNGDGIDDILIGVPYADPNGVNSAGESYLIFGNEGTWQAHYELAWMGKNIFSSTAGDDVFVASANDDVFDFDATWGDDTISSFEDGTDLLDFIDTGFAFAGLTISQSGSDTLIEDTNDNSLLLEGITSSNITIDDFLF